MKTATKYTKMDELNSFIDELKHNGFKVIVHGDNSSWAIFEKDSKLGYIQQDKRRGFSFSTVHKPCKRCGTGFSIHKEISKPSLNAAKDALAFAPNWASDKDMEAIVKYKSIEEYISKDSVLKYHIV